MVPRDTVAGLTGSGTRARFGKMLPGLKPYQVPKKLIDKLATRMREPDGGEDGALDHPDLPAGYTYFGQFLDHDLTFDPTSNLRRPNDPERLEDFRTPRLDLDAVYGSGPLDVPYLYDQATGPRGALLLVGDSRAQFGAGFAAEDLPRNVQGRALIGDPRNDENAIVAQLHLVFLKFHNRVARTLLDGGHAGRRSGSGSGSGSGDPAEVFREAQCVVRWHYQWMVVKDFLPRILPEGLADQPRFFRFDGEPFMPVEFSVGAYRFGHSLVRPEYELNARAVDVQLFSAHPGPLDAGHLGGFRPLLDRLVIDWSLFLELGGAQPQRARRLDRGLAGPLTSLPEDVAPPGDAGRSLAWLNLVRGRSMGLPSGQDVARALGVRPLADRHLGLGGAPAPLWYYVLAEAETLGGGRRLGPVGGRIVADVILGLLDADPQSFLTADPGWTPFLGAEPGRFSLADLVAYATDGRYGPAIAGGV